MRRDLAEIAVAVRRDAPLHSGAGPAARRRPVQVPVRHHPRTAGKTKYNLTRTFRVVLDLITVKFMHSYLTRPMHVMGFAGLAGNGAGRRRACSPRSS